MKKKIAPKTTPKIKKPVKKLSHLLKCETVLSKNAVPFNKEWESHLVVKLKAPKVNWQVHRAPICLMLAIDVSGSMTGAKLEQAKNSAQKIIENLKDIDYCGIVTFGSAANLISSPMLMNSDNKQTLSDKIRTIGCYGSTAFAEGMVLALQEVNRAKIPDACVVRVVMLTDGHANVGASDEAGLCSALTKHIGKASVSSFGYGDGANQDMMASIAKTGNGNYAFIENEDAALSAYAKELGGLLSQYARNLSISVNVLDTEISVVTDVKSDIRDGVTQLFISDILSEESRNIVLSLKGKRIDSQTNREVKVLISYDTLKKDGTVKQITDTVVLTLHLVDEKDASLTVDKSLDDIIGKAQLVRAQLEADKLAKKGQFDQAVRLMGMNTTDLKNRGLEGLSTSSEKIGGMMTNYNQYAASTSYRVSLNRGMTRGVGVAAYDAQALADLTEIGESVTTASQDAVIDAVTKDAKK